MPPQPHDGQRTNGDPDPPPDVTSEGHVTGEQTASAPEATGEKNEHRADVGETFSVVGIGASAGGLKAFSRFFDALPDDPGMAFVLVQHLAPNHESELADILQTHTALPVVQVEDGSRAEPGGVYVIPPGTQLSIRDGILHLADPEQPHGHRAPIDDFFRSLASDQGEHAVCIVLSGTGSDGSLGLKTIKEAGGLTLAQDPVDAEYDGMPRSAVSTGLVDVVLSAAELAVRLVELRRTGRPLPAEVKALPEDDSAALDAIFKTLRSEEGHDFSRYKESTVLRRIGRRMQVLGVESIADYARTLRVRADETPALLRDLLISVTSFFRDPEAFEALEEIIPHLFEDKRPDDQVRVWVPGCATGEEAYSIAMLLCEHASRLDNPPALQIFATDIDEDALAFAREGVYPETIAADVTPERLERFFELEGDTYRVKKAVRETVLFAVHNLLKDPPFSRLDLISCRNLLIYLQRETQQRLFELFAYALRRPGFLFLGSSESVEGTRDLFTVLDKKRRLFRGRGVTRPGLQFPILHPIKREPPRASDAPPERPSSLEDLHTQLLLTHHAPPSVVVGQDNEIFHVAGDASRYLTIPSGEPTHDLLRIVLPTLRPELRTALFYARDKGQTTERKHLRVTLGGEPVWVLLTVRPLAEPEYVKGFVQVVFEETPDDTATLEKPGDRPAFDHLKEELQHTQDRLQSAIEEYETSNEELRASNEELLSMNEELQSTTEELETGREELQSINEELVTVNQELKTKIEELNRANADLQNLIDSTDVATLFLDRDLRVARYTPRLADVFNVIPSDRGRPVGHLTQKMAYPEFVEDARQVLETFVPAEREVASEEGRYFLTRVIPYRTVDDRIDGVVATFVDITRRVRAEEGAQRRAERFRRAIAEAPLPVLLHAEDGEVLQLSRAFTEITGYTAADVPTIAIWTQLAYGDGQAEAVADIDRLYALDRRVDEGEYTVRTKDGAERIWQFSSAPVGTDEPGRRLVVSMAADVTERRRAEAAREVALEGGRLGTWSRDLVTDRVVFDERCLELYGLPPDAPFEESFSRVHPDDRDEIGARIAAALDPAGSGEYAAEHRFLTPEGDVRWMAARGRATFVGEGGERHPVQIAGVILDITEQKQVEEDLAAAYEALEAVNEALEERVEARTAALRESEARLRLLYDTISQPGADFDALVHKALERTAGLLGLRVGILSHVKDETYTVEACYAPGTGLEAGHAFPLGNTPCSMTLASDGPLAISDFAESELKGHPCRELFDIESYIGTPIRVDGTIYGTLNFSGPNPTHPPFSEADTELVSLLARWVEAVLERKHAQNQIEQSERTLAGVLLGSLEGIVALEAVRDSAGEVVDFVFLVVNPAAAEVYGRRVEELTGTRYLDCVPGTREGGVFDALVHVVETGQPYRDMVHYDADGIEGWFDYTVVRLSTGVALTFRDVTHQRQLEREVIEAAELERRRIGQDLHDGLGQQLTGAAFLGQVLNQKLAARNLPEAQDADQLTALINEVIAETRDLSRLLSPVDVQAEGLVDALQELTEQTERVFDISCPFLTEGDVVVSDNAIATHLFRITQEALNNAVKHAGPSEVTVRLRREEQGLRLQIEDDGTGMGAATLSQSSGLGLRAMQYRVALIGATLRIVPGAHGTTLSVYLPLDSQDEEQAKA